MEKCFRNCYIRRLLLLAAMAVYFSLAFYLMRKTGIGCIFLYLWKIPCPGCGMTRAILALLRLDFAAAFSWNPLIYAMPYVFCYVFFPMDGKIHRRILAIVGIAALINWLYRVLILWI